MKKILKIISFIILTLIIACFVFIYFCPLMRPYPMPTGKYAVGNQLLHWVDHENKYHLDKINEFNVDIFYPSNSTEKKQFLYRPKQIAAINDDVISFLSNGNKIKKMFWNLFLHDAYPYVQPQAEIPTIKFPVIIYLPGIAGYDMHALYLSELASHGYIVCAIEPPYDTAITVFPDGRHICLDQELSQAQQEKNRDFIYQYRNQAHIRWSKYIDMTIDKLSKLNNEPNCMWYQHLDLDRIGILGHSHGGAVALDYCQKNKRCSAGINMDGWTKTCNSTNTFNTPFLLMMGQYGGIIDIPQVKELIENNKRPDFQTIIIPDAFHGSFGDGILTSWPWTYLFEESLKNPEKIKIKISTNIVNFFNQYLKNI